MVRFNEQDLIAKGYIPDGKGGYRKTDPVQDSRTSKAVEYEKDLQRQCEQYLVKIGAWWLHLNEPRGNKAGIPDLVFLIKGTFFGVELKAKGRKARLVQLENLAWIKAQGGITAIVDNFQDFKALIDTNTV